MTTYTDIGLCSKALLKLGATSIASFEDGTAEAEISSNLYPLIRDGMLSSYPWSFAVAQVTLGRLYDSPLADYQYAYQLPNDMLRIVSAGTQSRGRGLEYCIKENTLHTNSSHVVLTYIFRALENSFPPFFSDALVARLAAEFCLPLTESSSRAEFLYKLAEEELKKARLIDAQQATPKKFEDFTLTEVRL